MIVSGKKIILSICLTAFLILAVASVSVAHPGPPAHPGQSPNKHPVAWVFKGTYTSDSAVLVKAGNSRVRKG